jgi:hypothetical protein
MLVTHWEFYENKLKTLWEQHKSSTPIFPQKKNKIMAFWAHGVMNFTLFFEWA